MVNEVSKRGCKISHHVQAVSRTTSQEKPQNAAERGIEVEHARGHHGLAVVAATLVVHPPSPVRSSFLRDFSVSTRFLSI